MNKIPYFLLALTLVLIQACSTPETGSQSEMAYDSLNYTIMLGDRIAGKQISWKQGDEYKYFFEFNDRGRGPSQTETVRLNENGFPEFIEITGVDYFKDSVDELFRITEGQAVWKNSAEDGYQSYDQDAFYFSVEGAASGDLMLRKLLQAQDKKLDLIPAGSIEFLSQEEFFLADSISVRLLTVSGIGFTPNYYWIDQNERLFALVGGWFSMIQDGYGELKEEMIKIQNEKEDAYYYGLAEDLTDEAPNGVRIKNVDIFDAKTGEIVPEQTIVIEFGDIEYIGPASGAPVDIEQEMEVIDGAGKTAIPGLFDMHGHLSKIDGVLNIAAGVTSVRDLANDTTILSMKKDYDEGSMIGPRFVTMCGFIDGAGPYAGPTGKIISSVEEGKEAIDFYHDLGYQQIKLYSSIKPEWVKPLVDYAHGNGMKVSGHIPAHMLAEEAIRDGYDEIQHMNMIFLNFLPDTIDTRTPLRFSMVAEYAQEMDLDGPEFESLIQLLKKEDIVVDPTVTAFEGMFKGQKKEPNPAYAMMVDRLPVTVRRGFYTGGLPKPGDKLEKYTASHDQMVSAVKKLYDSGVRIVAGTDGLVGFTLYRELEMYEKSGIPAEEVLRIATLGAAEVAGVSDKLGSIEVGKKADIVLLAGNPVNNISDIRKVDVVIKDGHVYKSSDLYNAMGVKPYDLE